MASLSGFKLNSYHQSMMDKLTGITARPSDNAQSVIAGLQTPPVGMKKSTKLDSIKVPDATAVANAVQRKVAMPTIMAPTGGGISANVTAGVPRVSSGSSGSVSSSGGGSLDNFLAKIAKKESGGNYGAVNKDSGALGKYQVMPANVASWTKQALGKSLTPQQYLASKDAQEAVAKKVLGGYLSKYGEEGAAIAWYSGESNAKKHAKTGQVSTKAQGGGKYPSIAAYAAAIAGRK